MRHRCWTIGTLLGAALLTAPASPGLGHARPAGTLLTAQADHGQATPAMPMHEGTEHRAREDAVPHAAEPDDLDPVLRAFREANERMHAAMSVPGTGDADRDFAAAMIAHHEGAIEMAEILLEHGRDPDLRALAEEIIEVQKREIEFLQEWLAANPG